MRNAALQCPKSPDNAVRHEWSGHSESLATESNLWRIRHEERDFRPSLLSREKKILLTRALGGARTAEPARTCSSHVCLSAVVPAFAEPDIHSLSQVHAVRHLRFGACSLPVLKQLQWWLGQLICVPPPAT